MATKSKHFEILFDIVLLKGHEKRFSIVEVVFFYYFIKVLVEVSKIQLFYKCTYRDCTASAMEAAMLDDIASF